SIFTATAFLKTWFTRHKKQQWRLSDGLSILGLGNIKYFSACLVLLGLAS
ncbi:23937_t:CDS:1, partial [Racocetra persica]